jgi:hypothetical protein
MLAMTAHGTTLTVKSLADSGGTCPGSTCTLRQAIATADPGDTINFSLPANSTITLTSAELLISRNLTIIGPGANLLTVQRSTANGTQAFRILDIAGSNLNVTISGLTVTNGSDRSNGGGGGIFNSATLTLAGVIISGNNTAETNIPNGTSFGGGIFNSGTLTITNCTISANTVSGGSGGGFQIVEGGGLSTTAR